MSKEELLAKIKQIVLTIEPDAQVILYGSRARGDAGIDSDWDFLILLHGKVADSRVKQLRHHLYLFELESDQIFSALVLSTDEWETTLISVTPFHDTVVREGVLL